MNGNQPYAFGTFSVEDQTFPGLVVEEQVWDLRPLMGSATTIAGLLDDWDNAETVLQAHADRGRDDGRSLSDVTALAPIQPPRQVFQSGANYRKHVLDLMSAADDRGDSSDGLDESGREQERAELDERARTGRPFVFLGSPHAVTGAFGQIELPPESSEHDWELELAVVIGRRARRVAREHASEVIAGYTICNDITTRDALYRADASALGMDWLAGKNAPTFLPLGPYIVPAAHVADPMDLQIRLKVNGDTMQDESTADMLFDIAQMIEHISHVAELRPGDLVLTGSPAGNGASRGVFLKPGDVIDSTITGLGQQRNVCVAEPVGTPTGAAH